MTARTNQNFVALGALIAAGSILSACSPLQSEVQPSRQQSRSAKGDLLMEEATVLNATGDKVENWFTKGPEEGVHGVNAEKAYRELNIRTGVEPVVVAVIDSGIDLQHEDLRDKLWVNLGEIPGNGVDDDNNGYVDDVNGWNFLGGYRDGRVVNVNDATLEVTRELVRMKGLRSRRSLTPQELEYLGKVESEVEKSRESAQRLLDRNVAIQNQALAHYRVLYPLLNVQLEDVTRAQVEELEVEGDDSTARARRGARMGLIGLFESNGLSSMARVYGRVNYARAQLNSYYNESFQPRAGVVSEEDGYGNHDVEGPDAGHGTHVAGIIGAIRGNGKGIDGIATDVRLMSLRAVPNGDEYDSDVANAVTYAVDNGAKIINMSFGKSYSPGKAEVDAAFQYAESRGVLVLHAAGNDNRDLDHRLPFPNRVSKSGKVFDNWLVVGASAALANAELPAFFSNFGRNTVDLFSPGHRLKSPVPEENEYATYSGTSMATPAAAGVAALVWSQYPGLTVAELKRSLLESVRLYPDLVVKRPGTQDAVTFSSLSMTGGIVDAYQALEKAKAIYHRTP